MKVSFQCCKIGKKTSLFRSHLLFVQLLKASSDQFGVGILVIYSICLRRQSIIWRNVGRGRNVADITFCQKKKSFITVMFLVFIENLRNVVLPLARKRIMASVPSLQILTGGYCSPGSVSTISLSRLWQFPKDLGSFFNLTFLLRSSVLSLFSLDMELGSSLSAFSRRSRLCSLNKSPMESGSFFSLLWCT